MADYIDDLDDDDDDRPRQFGKRMPSTKNNQQRGRQNFRQQPQQQGFFQARRKVCPVRIEDISWRKLDSLRYFVGDHGQMRPRRKTGATAKMQRQVAVAVKRARFMALLPYTGLHTRLMRQD